MTTVVSIRRFKNVRSWALALAALGGAASASVAYGQATLAETAQTLDRVDIIYASAADNIAINTELANRPWESSDYQITGTSFTQCQNTATRGIYCLDGNTVKRFPNPSATPATSITLFDCANPAFNFDRDNICTALTADITGNIWLSGKRRKAFSLYKVVQSNTAPDAGSVSPSQWTRFVTTAGTFWTREYASGRPQLLDLAVIDGDTATAFPLGGGRGGVIAVEQKAEVTFFPDVPYGTSVVIGNANAWGLVRPKGGPAEAVQSATLLQKYLPAADVTRNWLLITTSSGRLLSREVPWAPAAPASLPVIDHSTTANLVASPTVAAACAGLPTALYDIQSSVKSRSIYVTDRRGCRALALTTNIDSSGFALSTPITVSAPVVVASTSPDASATPLQAALQSPPQAVSIAPGVALSMAQDCPVGKVCPLVGDGGDTGTVPAASMTAVKLDPTSPDGLVVFQIQNIPDCRYIKKGLQPTCLTAVLTPDGTPVQYDANDFPVNPGQLFLNVKPLLPLEVTRVKAIPDMLISPRYRALADKNTFDALFGITENGVRFRDTFEAHFDLGDLMPGRKIGCGGENVPSALINTAIGPRWDILVTISENYKTVGGLPNGGPQHTDMLVNKSGCTPLDPPAAGTRWSMYAYGLQMAADVPDVTSTPANETRYTDSILAKLTLSLFKDLGETIDTYACVDRDGGTGAPITASSCSGLQASWFNTNDKLTKCVFSSTQPLNSTEIRTCNAFEVQYAPFAASINGLVKSSTASDPANRVGELKARLEVFRYVYDSQFQPSIPANTGFSDPL